MMCVNHILVNPPDQVPTILTLNILTVHINMPTCLSYKSASCSLKHKTYTKEWIILLLFKTGLSELCFKGHGTLLLGWKLVSHDFKYTYLAENYLFLVDHVLL